VGPFSFPPLQGYSHFTYSVVPPPQVAETVHALSRLEPTCELMGRTEQLQQGRGAGAGPVEAQAWAAEMQALLMMVGS
jgi:hypothetical protein